MPADFAVLASVTLNKSGSIGVTDSAITQFLEIYSQQAQVDMDHVLVKSSTTQLSATLSDTRSILFPCNTTILTASFTCQCESEFYQHHIH